MMTCFSQKKILVTGHTGFKGSWLCESLLMSGAIVSGFSDKVPTNPSIFEDIDLKNRLAHDIRGEIQDIELLKSSIDAINPDIIFHLAAQPLVFDAYENPLHTWHTNTIGTINILESLKNIEHDCICVFITSDKSYKNVEQIWGYKETDQLGGHDPYSASKAAAELAIESYFNSFLLKKDNIRVAVARAGNVIGGGDWSPNRIVPDCIKSWLNTSPVKLRNPHSTRPWQHVLEPLNGYMALAESLLISDNINGQAFNFGPNLDQNKTVYELVMKLNESYGGSNVEIPENIKSVNKAECNLLKLNCEKSFHILDWSPKLAFEECVNMTSDWYKCWTSDRDEILSFTRDQITWYNHKDI